MHPSTFDPWLISYNTRYNLLHFITEAFMGGERRIEKVLL
jgi:hypothetical protein